MAKLKDSKVDDHIKGKVGITEQTGEKDIQWDATQGEVESDVHLEDDKGVGNAIIVRSFDFKANPQAFLERTPTKQELFNDSARLIEIQLWKDGLQVMPDVNPKVMISKNKQNYRIVVGAEPAKGHLLGVTPQTLSQIANKK